MSVRRTKVAGETALIAQVSPTLWKIVYPSGKVTFAVQESEASDSEWDESKHPRGDRGRFTHGQGTLSSDELRSIRMYARQHYAGLNRHLRLGLPLTDTAEQMRRDLDAVLERSKLHTDAVFYRGLGRSEKILGGLKVGEEVTNLAYISTTPEVRVAGLFSDFKSGVMEISVPRNTSALDVGALSGAEPEVLLPRNTTLRYLGRGAPRTSDKDVSRSYRFEVVRVGKALDWNPFQPRVPKGEAGGGQWAGENLTKRERAEVVYYTGDGYAHINSSLRQGERYVVRESVEILDSVIAKSVIDHDISVFRGVNSRAFTERLDSLTPGDEVVDRAYLSTSGSFLSAAMYGGIGAPVMEVRVPAGSNVLYAESMSANTGIGEEEYLLPRDTTLRFASKRVVGGGVGESKGSMVYTFDLAPRAAKDWNPFQPRVPKGETGGGEWTEGGSTGGGKLSFAGNKSVGLQAVHTDALKQYTANIYYPVNKALRAKPMEQLTDAESKVVSALDEAFERAMKTTEVMQLFRAAGEEFASVVDTIKVGDDVVDPAFVSTTTDENYARTLLSGQPGEKKALIEVVLPKDSRAIDTSPYNPFKGENETLLPRDTTFRYLGKERDVYRFRANPRPIAA